MPKTVGDTSDKTRLYTLRMLVKNMANTDVYQITKETLEWLLSFAPKEEK